MIKNDEVKFTVRLHPETAKKLVYVAKYYGRSQNKQIDWVVKKCIQDFEHKHGPIKFEDT